MTVTTSASHQKLLTDIGAPTQSDQLEQWVAWVLDWPLADVKKHLQAVQKHLGQVDPDDHQFLREQVMTGVSLVCKKLGLPCEPARYEQPYLVFKLFPTPVASLSLHEFATEPDDDERPMEPLTPILLLLWEKKLHEIVDSYLSTLDCTDDALRAVVQDMTVIGFRLTLFMWSGSVSSEVELLLYYSEYLTFTRSCFNLESGDLTPEGREIATLREYIYRFGGDK